MMSLLLGGFDILSSLEAVRELASDGLEVSHTASAGSLSALRLLAPLDYTTLLVSALFPSESIDIRTFSDLSSRKAARRAGALLNVP